MTTHALARFAGGPPAMVAVRLIVVSLVVGLVLETFGFDPSTLISDAVRSARAIVELGFTDIHEIGRILITGAMVVVPVWLALRLLEFEPGAIRDRRQSAQAPWLDRGLGWDEGLTRSRRAGPLRLAGYYPRGKC